MAVAIIILVVNIVITSVRNERVGNDPWGDGRTMEWALPSPPPFYNFKQLPLVRGLDAYWLEKMEGKKEITPAEPLGDIHMPNGSIITFSYFTRILYCFLWCHLLERTFMGHSSFDYWTCHCIWFHATRSLKDDHGFHIP